MRVADSTTRESKSTARVAISTHNSSAAPPRQSKDWRFHLSISRQPLAQTTTLLVPARLQVCSSPSMPVHYRTSFIFHLALLAASPAACAP